MLQLSKLLESLTVFVDQKNPSLDISGIASDSRDVQDGFLFTALPGVKDTGTKYMADAVSNGAVAIMAPKGTKLPEIALQNHVLLVESDNVRLDLSKISARFYPNQPDHIFGVTGTNGKTSVAHFVAQLYGMKNVKAASLGTLGLMSADYTVEGSLTTADPINLHRMLHTAHEKGTDVLAMEISSHGLDQHRADSVTFEAAAFTNLSQDHLDYHPSMDDYFDAKARLFTQLLKPGSRAVINADDPWGQKLMDICHDKGLSVQSFGRNGHHFKITSITPTATGQDVIVAHNNQEHHLSLSLMGEFQAYNALCAFILSGLDIQDLPRVEQLQTVDGRMEFVGTTPQGGHVFVDYAHTPDALVNVLQAARKHTQGKLHVIFGCGGDRDKTKRPLMAQACGENADVVILTDDNPRGEDPQSIRNDAKAGFSDVIEIGDRKKAIVDALAMLSQGDTLIIAGKGHEDGQTIQGVKYPFHDVSVAREGIDALSGGQK